MFTYDFLDRLASDTNFLFTFGDTGVASSKVRTPWKPAVDPSGNVWVADTGRNRIAKYNSSGVFQYAYGSYGSGSGQFNQSSAIATAVIDGQLYLFVTDYGNNRVQKLRDTGSSVQFVLQWGSFGADPGPFFEGPSDIAYYYNPGTQQHLVYVVDTFNHRIQYFTADRGDPNGADPNWWGSYGNGDANFNYPQGITIDSAGNVYVADGFNRKVKRYTSSGVWIATGGSSGSGPGQFGFLRDVSVDSAGNILLVFVCGALGAALGVLAVYCSARMFRSGRSVWARYFVSGLASAFAVVLFLVGVAALRLLIKR